MVIKASALVLATLLALGGFASATAAPSRRVAIVAGVADYGGVGNLTNTVRDAREMGLVLGKLGFEVRVLEGPKSGDI